MSLASVPAYAEYTEDTINDAVKEAYYSWVDDYTPPDGQDFSKYNFLKSLYEMLYGKFSDWDFYVIALDKQNHPHNIKLKNRNGFVLTDKVLKKTMKIIVGCLPKADGPTVSKATVQTELDEIKVRNCPSGLGVHRDQCNNRMCDDILADLRQKPNLQNVTTLGVINRKFHPMWWSYQMETEWTRPNDPKNGRFVVSMREGGKKGVNYLVYAFS